MTPTEIAAMQADREAGTKGPWDVHPNCDGHMGRLDVVGPTLTCRGFTIATNVDARKAARINSDANRIARVPDMEAQIIADAAYIAELEAIIDLADEALLEAIIDLADEALSEAEAILGGEYGDQYGPLCEIMVELQSKISARLILNKEKADE